MEACFFKNYEKGDCYGYVAIKRHTFFHICHAVGKWTAETADEFVGRMKSRLDIPTHKYRLKIFSDGNYQYNTALLKHFREDTIDYGQLLKFKENGKLVNKVKVKVYGNPSYDDIETICIESYNSVLRNSISRLVRRTKSFSKKRAMLDLALEFHQTYNNFIKKYHNETPAMREGIAKGQWSWKDIFYAKLTFIN